MALDNTKTEPDFRVLIEQLAEVSEFVKDDGGDKDRIHESVGLAASLAAYLLEQYEVWTTTDRDDESEVFTRINWTIWRLANVWHFIYVDEQSMAADSEDEALQYARAAWKSIEVGRAASQALHCFPRQESVNDR